MRIRIVFVFQVSTHQLFQDHTFLKVYFQTLKGGIRILPVKDEVVFVALERNINCANRMLRQAGF